MCSSRATLVPPHGPIAKCGYVDRPSERRAGVPAKPGPLPFRVPSSTGADALLGLGQRQGAAQRGGHLAIADDLQRARRGRNLLDASEKLSRLPLERSGAEQLARTDRDPIPEDLARR